MPFIADAVPSTPITSVWANSIRDRVVMSFASAAQRTSQWAAPPEGAISYLADVDQLFVYTGAAWVALSAASDSPWQTIQDVTRATDGPILFAAIPQTFRHLQIIGNLRSLVVQTAGFVLLRFNGDASAVYSSQLMRNVTGAVSGIATNANAATGQLGAIPGASASASIFGTLDTLIPNYRTSMHKSWRSLTGWFDPGVVAATDVVHGTWRNVAAVTQIELFNQSTANIFAAGSSATLIGMR